MMQYKLGVLGGMGPLATIKIVEKIIDLTIASRDQDHIPMLICNNPTIVDRTYSICKRESLIYDMLVDELKVLEKAKVERIIMPCNTAHYYINKLQKLCNIPIINMVSTTLNYIERSFPNQKVTVFGTIGLYAGEVYDRFKPSGVKLRMPPDSIRTSIMRMITNIKETGNLIDNASLLQEHIKMCVLEGINVIILACTELSMLNKYVSCHNVDIVDAAEVLAIGAILQVGYKVDNNKTKIDSRKLKITEGQ